MDSKPIGSGEGTSSVYGSTKASKEKKKPEEESILGKVKDFFEENVIGVDSNSPYHGKQYKVNKKMYAVAAAETVAGGAAGYAVGASHQAADVITHETVVKDVMKLVKVGEQTVTGGSHYHYGMHYDLMEGEMKFGYHFGYDPSYVHTEPIMEKVPTGEKVSEIVTHHTESYPHTKLQGLLIGTLLGGALGVATLALSKLLAVSKSD